jgi:hypothetical protein
MTRTLTGEQYLEEVVFGALLSSFNLRQIKFAILDLFWRPIFKLVGWLKNGSPQQVRG